MENILDPKEVFEKKFLEYYASQLGAVEIDYTSYRMPTSKTLDSWKASTGEAFRFALKASRRITHYERLRVPAAALDYGRDLLEGRQETRVAELFGDSWVCPLEMRGVGYPASCRYDAANPTPRPASCQP